ncbi:TIGR03086 family metal-binding protein [Rhodococcus sp. UNC363MFTsu5.1]|uniref:TIGR03086 family metal-binding protein n=1 Tax=Rhodococcus sp. UNC363MFTsu5.1 TaxID=1449069 RepID=UPI00068B9C6E|nr:TIGR03086 family metal-binding protein [Rhodococcus sp. UNC363MFTsu5.1]
MTGAAVAWPLADPVALLERSIAYTVGSLQLVTEESMGGATPCRGWDLRELLAHMNDALGTLQEAALDHHIALAPAAAGPDPAADPVAALCDRACRLLGSWARSGDPEGIQIGGVSMAAGIVPAAGALEIAVHGWDVARACGRDRPIPPDLAEELLTCATLFVSDADRPARFAAPVEIPAGAGPGERLLALLGRDPRA